MTEEPCSFCKISDQGLLIHLHPEFICSACVNQFAEYEKFLKESEGLEDMEKFESLLEQHYEKQKQHPPVSKLKIAHYSNYYLCEECIDLCLEIIEIESQK